MSSSHTRVKSSKSTLFGLHILRGQATKVRKDPSGLKIPLQMQTGFHAPTLHIAEHTLVCRTPFSMSSLFYGQQECLPKARFRGWADNLATFPNVLGSIWYEDDKLNKLNSFFSTTFFSFARTCNKCDYVHQGWRRCLGN